MWEPLHHLIVSVDVEHSSQFGDPSKVGMRDLVHTVFQKAFAGVGAGPGDYDAEDRGDGVLAVVRPAVPETRMVGWWVAEANEELRALNRDRLRPVRIRIGMHAGKVTHDEHGFSGTAVDHACRLADSGAARRTLAAATGSHLALIVSDLIYDSVVRHGGKFVTPEAYRRVRVSEKETEATAWVYAPGWYGPGDVSGDVSGGAAEEVPDRGPSRSAESSSAAPGAGGPIAVAPGQDAVARPEAAARPAAAEPGGRIIHAERYNEFHGNTMTNVDFGDDNRGAAGSRRD